MFKKKAPQLKLLTVRQYLNTKFGCGVTSWRQGFKYEKGCEEILLKIRKFLSGLGVWSDIKSKTLCDIGEEERFSNIFRKICFSVSTSHIREVVSLMNSQAEMISTSDAGEMIEFHLFLIDRLFTFEWFLTEDVVNGILWKVIHSCWTKRFLSMSLKFISTHRDRKGKMMRLQLTAAQKMSFTSVLDYRYFGSLDNKMSDLWRHNEMVKSDWRPNEQFRIVPTPILGHKIIHNPDHWNSTGNIERLRFLHNDIRQFVLENWKHVEEFQRNFSHSDFS